LSSLIHTATAGTIDTRLRHTSLASTSIPAPARPCLRSFPGGAVTALSGAGSSSPRSSTHPSIFAHLFDPGPSGPAESSAPRPSFGFTCPCPCQSLPSLA
jgi:hypothetical protein